MAPHCTFLLASFALILLPESEQFPQNVVFQPVTYQLATPAEVKESSDLVFAKVDSVPRSEDVASSLVCKQILPEDPLAKFLSPAAPSSPLVYFPSADLPSFIQDPAVYRLSSGFVTSSGLGNLQNDPTYLSAPPPPLIAAVCVNSDSPRPFPVLFSPPAPPAVLKNDDFAKMSPTASLLSPASMKLLSEEGLKLDLHIPAANGLTLGLNGVPASIERSAGSKEHPAGAVLVKLHANPSGLITVSLPSDARTDLLQGERSAPVSTISRGDGVSSASPSVSLVFSSPVGSIGIGSSNSPAVNIERQSIISGPAASSSASEAGKKH